MEDVAEEHGLADYLAKMASWIRCGKGWDSEIESVYNQARHEIKFLVSKNKECVEGKCSQSS